MRVPHSHSSLFFFLCLLCLFCALPLSAQTTERVSVGGFSAWANNASYRPALSADGRFVAFVSSATNFVPGDINGKADVFVFDSHTGQTVMASVSSNGTQANDDCGGSITFGTVSYYGLDLSADGRFVAFSSRASNLVEGDTNNTWDIFVHDLTTRETRRVSISSTGAQSNDMSYLPSLSADGRYICFTSGASTLVSGDTNGRYDVFVHDRASGQTSRVSVNSAGAQGDENSGSPTAGAPDISADGRYVAFVSGATNFYPFDNNSYSHVYVHDRQTGFTTRVSVGNDGLGGANYGASISDDGRYVCFASSVDTLVPGDTNRASDVFVHDRIWRYTTRISVNAAGEQGNGSSGWIDDAFEPDTTGPRISGNGRYIVYSSRAYNLVPNDTNNATDVFRYDQMTGLTERLSQNSAGIQGNTYSVDGALSGDGRYAAFASASYALVDGDRNGAADVFLRDNTLATIRRMAASLESSGSSTTPSLSSDGRYVAFSSEAANLVANDTNGYSDIFVYDRTLHKTERVNVSSSGEQANLPSGYSSLAISPDGRYVAFQSWASNLVPNDSGTTWDAFVHDRMTRQTRRVSVNSVGNAGNSAAGYYTFAFPADNRYILFSTNGRGLVAGDNDDTWDVFIHDLTTGQTQRVSVNAQGEPGNGISYAGICSANGRFIAFISAATNLVENDTNGKYDVFVRDNTTGQIKRVSLSNSGAQANGDSGAANLAISSNGRFVCFSSAATNLVENDTNSADDVFVHDTLTGQTTRVSISSSGEQANRKSGLAGLAMSSDGQTIAFHSEATNLTGEVVSGQGGVYVHNRVTGETQLVSVNDAGEEGVVWGYYGLHLSADGRHVAFESATANLVPDDFNETSDIFVRGPLYVGNTVTGTLTLEERAQTNSTQPFTFEFRSPAGDFLFFRTADIGFGGQYALEGVPNGDYQVHISGLRYLAANVTIHVAGDLSGVNALLRAGDANGDNACDVFDLDALIQAFDTNPDHPQWIAGADFNADDSVDVFDLDLLIRNFDSTGDE